jgi:hypothetical protein
MSIYMMDTQKRVEVTPGKNGGFVVTVYDADSGLRLGLPQTVKTLETVIGMMRALGVGNE